MWLVMCCQRFGVRWILVTLGVGKSWMQRDNLLQRVKEMYASPQLERLMHQQDRTSECYFGSLITGFNKKHPV
jgi:hypothetical protein